MSWTLTGAAGRLHVDSCVAIREERQAGRGGGKGAGA